MEIVRNNGLRIRDTQTSMDVLRFPDVKLNNPDQIAWFGSPMYQLGTGTNDWLYGGLNVGGWQDITRPTTAQATIENIGLGVPNIGIVGLRGVPLKFDSTRISPYNTGTGQPYLDFPGLVGSILSNPSAWGVDTEYIVKGTNKQGTKVVRIMAPTSSAVGKAALSLSGIGSSNLLELIATGDNGIQIVAGGQAPVTGEATYDSGAVIGSIVVAKDNTIKILGSKSGSDLNTTLATFNINTGTLSLPGDFILGSTTIRTNGLHNISFPNKDGVVVLDRDFNDYRADVDNKLSEMRGRLNRADASINNCFMQMGYFNAFDKGMQDIGNRTLRYTTSAPGAAYIDSSAPFYRDMKSASRGLNGGTVLVEDIMGENEVPSSGSSNGYYQPGYWLTVQYKNTVPVYSQIAGLGLKSNCWHSIYGLILGSREADTGVKIIGQSTPVGSLYTLTAPAKNGTLALQEDVPTKEEVASTYAPKSELQSYYKIDSSQYIFRPIKVPAWETHWVGGKVVGGLRMDIPSGTDAFWPVLSFGFVDDAHKNIKKVELRSGGVNPADDNNDIELVQKFGKAMAMGGIEDSVTSEFGIYVYDAGIPTNNPNQLPYNYVTSRFVYDWTLGMAQWHCEDSMTLDKDLTVGKGIFAGEIYRASDSQDLHDAKTPSKTANKAIIKEFRPTGEESIRYGVIAQEIEDIGLGHLVNTDEAGAKSVDYISLLCLMIKDLQDEVKELKSKLSQ